MRGWEPVLEAVRGALGCEPDHGRRARAGETEIVLKDVGEVDAEREAEREQAAQVGVAVPEKHGQHENIGCVGAKVGRLFKVLVQPRVPDPRLQAAEHGGLGGYDGQQNLVAQKRADRREFGGVVVVSTRAGVVDFGLLVGAMGCGRRSSEAR